MLRSKRLRNEDAPVVPPSPAPSGNPRTSTMTPLRVSYTPMRQKKYEMGEQKELIDIFLRVRPVSEGQKNMLINSTSTSIVMPTKV